MKQRYDSYKPSGIDWIGEIPSHWELCPIKHIKSTKEFAFVDGPFGSNLKSEHFIENGDVYVIESGFITTGKFVYKKFKTISKDHFETIRRSECTAGDVIIAKIGYNYGMVGELPKLDKPSVVSGNSLKITLDNSKILNYIFINLMNLAKNRNAYIGLVQETAQPALSLSGLNNFILPVPPLSEQEAIAAWLDEKCDEIDTAIAKVDREIELIDELKQSEISRVVTRGLNPDAPLRPSGIDWIGDVPAHWETCRLKHKATVTLGKMLMSEPPKDQEHLYTKERYLKSRNIGWLELELSDVEEMWFNGVEKYLYELHDNDIVVNEGGDIGKVALWKSTENSYYIQNSVHKVSLNSGEPRFLLYWLYCLSIRNYFWSIVSQVSIAHLTKEKLSNAPLIFPPISEQLAIADYLDKKCAQIDGLKEKLVKKRDTLKELRQAIISEVVTGKRKVI